MLWLEQLNISEDVTTSKITSDKTITSDKPITSDKAIINTTTPNTTAPNTSSSDQKIAPASTLTNTESKPTATETTNGQKITYLLPVNVFNNKINLKVDVLPDFKKIPSVAGQEQTLIEFISISDTDPYKWSEIITVSPIIGAKINAAAFLDFFLEEFKKNATEVKVLDSFRKADKDYQTGYSIIQYHVGERDEIVLVYAASGPYDLATAQYALHLTKTDKTSVDAAVQKLKAFMKNNLQVMVISNPFLDCFAITHKDES